MHSNKDNPPLKTEHDKNKNFLASEFKQKFAFILIDFVYLQSLKKVFVALKEIFVHSF